MRYHHGMPWGTFDVNNDPKWAVNCPITCHGAWWYNQCDFANLNGLYNSTSTYMANSWAVWLGHAYPLKATQMKIRPAD